MKKIILLFMLFQLPACAYYDASADYSHGSQTYDEYVLGAPSRAHEAHDFLTPQNNNYSNKRGSQIYDYQDQNNSEQRKVIIYKEKSRTMFNN